MTIWIVSIDDYDASRNLRAFATEAEARDFVVKLEAYRDAMPALNVAGAAAVKAYRDACPYDPFVDRFDKYYVEEVPFGPVP